METYQAEQTEAGEKKAPISWLAEAVGLSRKCLGVTTSTEKNEPRLGDNSLKERIVAVLSVFPRYGYRRVTAHLRRTGDTINKKRIQRVMRACGLVQKRKKRTIKTTDSTHRLTTFPNLIKDIVPNHPFHVLAADITYVRLEHGFCYVAMVIDIFTRKVVGWAVDTHMETSLVMTALNMSLTHGTPDYHHSDRGAQYCSHEYVDTLTKRGTQISMADVGMSVDNPYAESMNKTLKQEEVYLKEYRTVDDARHSISTFIDNVYNKKRLHSSIGYVPPEEFEQAWFAKQSDVEPSGPLQTNLQLVSLSA